MRSRASPRTIELTIRSSSRSERDLLEDGAKPLETRRRPERPRVVIDLERGHAFRERDPGHLGARVDVDVRLDARRLVERARADEEDLRPRVDAVDRNL